MPASPRSIPIVVLAGQSNANNGVIIDAAFRQAAAGGGLLVHKAVNGSPLASHLDRGGGDWSAGGGAGEGEHLKGLMQQLDSILNPTSSSYVPGAYLASVIWVHGGADIYSYSAATGYQANLAAVKDALSDRYGDHRMVIAGMADASYERRDLPDYAAKNWKRVQAAQERLAAEDPDIVLVDPDTVASRHGLTAADMFLSDNIHYTNTAGFSRYLGQDLAHAALPPVPNIRTEVASASGGPIHYTGGYGHDSFRIVGAGLLQVLGNGGSDSIFLTDRATGVTVSTLSSSNHRVVGNTGGPALVVDLILVETLHLTSGHDRVGTGGNLREVHAFGGNDKVIGSAGAERIFLGAGFDFAFSGGGNDLISGESGSDTLWGGTGDDQLFGGSSSDRLGGGAGQDTLTGGTGADQFVFFASEGNDHVTDFQNGIDKLWMRGQVWGDLRFVAMGADTLVQGLNHSVLLQNVSVGMLDASDFLFSA